MPNRWFVTLDGREQGPLDAKTIKIMVDKQLIGPETPVRRDDLTHAVPARKIKGLLPPQPGSGQSSAVTAQTTTTHRANTPAFSPTTTQVRRDPPAAAQPAAAPSGPRRDPRPSKRLTERSGPPSSAPQRPAALRVSEAGTAGVALEEDGDAGADPFTTEIAIAARAGFGRRILAHLIDATLLMVLSAVVVIAGMMLLFAGKATEEKAAKKSWETNQPAETYLQVPYLEWQKRRPFFDAYVNGGAQLPDAPAIVAASATQAKQTKDNDVAYVKEWIARFDKYEVSAVERGALEAGNLYVFGMLIIIAGSVVLALLVPLSEAIWSTTLGKKLMGLRILDREGRRIGPGRAILRHILRIIPFGQLRALAHDRLALHDLLAGTEVTRRGAQRKRATTRSVRESTPPPVKPPLPPPSGRRRA